MRPIIQLLEKLAKVNEYKMSGITSIYKITFRDENAQNKFEAFLAFIQYCGAIGHSTEIKFFVDGDGSGQIQIHKDGQLLNWKDIDKKKLNINADGDLESIGIE